MVIVKGSKKARNMQMVLIIMKILLGIFLSIYLGPVKEPIPNVQKKNVQFDEKITKLRFIFPNSIMYLYKDCIIITNSLELGYMSNDKDS